MLSDMIDDCCVTVSDMIDDCCVELIDRSCVTLSDMIDDCCVELDQGCRFSVFSVIFGPIRSPPIRFPFSLFSPISSFSF